MRVPAVCPSCDSGRAMVYATVRRSSFVVRYRKCDRCNETSKTILVLSSNELLESARLSAMIGSVHPSPAQEYPWQRSQES